MNHKDLGLTNANMLEMYRLMLLTRKIDEKNWLLNRSGRVPFVVSGQGHEAAQIAAAFALDRTKDYIAPYYRDLGLVLAFGMSARDLYLSYFAKKEDPNSGGKQMPNHFSSRALRILTHSSPVTTQVLHAAGIAYACKLDGKNDIVTLTSFGEGSANQGDFHEAANFAGLYKLPVIFVCQNNGYAISTAIDKQVSGNIYERAKGYGFHGELVNGLDLLASYKAMKEAVERARSGEGPTLLEVKVKRLTSHSSDDDHRSYIEEEEIKALKSHDPLAKTLAYLMDNKIIDEAAHEVMLKEIDDMVTDAIKYADAAEPAKAEFALTHVYAS